MVVSYRLTIIRVVHPPSATGRVASTATSSLKNTIFTGMIVIENADVFFQSKTARQYLIAQRLRSRVALSGWALE
jgi:hypothetical protein